MLGEGLDAASAGYRVGYYNAAHFNREYKSLFGLPPMRDMERLLGTIRLRLPRQDGEQKHCFSGACAHRRIVAEGSPTLSLMSFS